MGHWNVNAGVPADNNIKMKESETREYHQYLARLQSKMSKMNVEGCSYYSWRTWNRPKYISDIKRIKNLRKRWNFPDELFFGCQWGIWLKFWRLAWACYQSTTEFNHSIYPKGNLNDIDDDDDYKNANELRESNYLNSDVKKDDDEDNMEENRVLTKSGICKKNGYVVGTNNIKVATAATAAVTAAEDQEQEQEKKNTILKHHDEDGTLREKNWKTWWSKK